MGVKEKIGLETRQGFLNAGAHHEPTTEVRLLGHDMKANQPDLPYSSSCTRRTMPPNRKPLPDVCEDYPLSTPSGNG